MEILYKNQLDTTTQLDIASGTLTQENIFTRDQKMQYYTSGYNDDATTASITINFDQTTSIDRIALLETNWKDFTVFYDGTTANTFALTSTGSTITSDFSNNSETSLYMAATTVNCTSVTFDILSTQIANSEKAVGMVVLSSKLYDFDKIPSSKGYKPTIVPDEVEHKMADGGRRIQRTTNKFRGSIKLKYISESFRNNLYDLWNDADDFIFVGFATMASWDEVLYEVVWPGKFDFFTYSDDAVATGFSGTINLREITK